MHAVEGLFADENKQFAVKKKPNLLFAQEIMYSQEYHTAKKTNYGANEKVFSKSQ